jgi:hypothetical protein
MTIAKLPLAKDIEDFTSPARRSTRPWCATSPAAPSSPSSATPCSSAAPAPARRHLAIAIARACIRRRRRGRFFTVVDLVNRLETEARAGRQGRWPTALTRLDFVVLDELGYLPFAQTGGQLLFHLISRLYERPRSSSPPTSPSANGRASSATPR